MPNDNAPFHILVVDDEPHQRRVLEAGLGAEGYQISCVNDGLSALKVLEDPDHTIDAIISDLSMPLMDGLELLKRAKALQPGLGFIMITAHGTVETAIEAMKRGAFDYVSKPIDLDDLNQRVHRLIEMVRLRIRAEALKQDTKRLPETKGLIASSKKMASLIKELERVAPTQATILLQGETGVGKEVIAQYIHKNSQRSTLPFVAVNCSAIPENLAESEFFGHEKGSFTGATKQSTGFFQQAQRGTLFLDEIGELDLKLQPKILRALEERKVRRVGSTLDQPVNIRLICASHRNLSELVAAGAFREDLFFRLNVVKIEIPPLRERKDEIPELVRFFIERFQRSLNVKVEQIEPAYIERLQNHHFPGNVRELANIVERSLIYNRKGVLSLDCLPKDLGDVPSMSSPALGVNHLGKKTSLPEILSNFEKEVLSQALTRNASDVDETARELGVSRSTLYSKLSKHHLK